MDINQLKYFCTTAKIENISKAAEILFISQPSLSLSIQRLEKELGIPLFDRVGRNIRLNSQGKIFLEHASNVLNEMDIAQQRMNTSKQNEAPRVSILTHQMISQQTLVEQVLTQFPKLTLNISASQHSQMYKRLLDGEAELCITLDKIDDTLEYQLIHEEELQLLLPQDYPIPEYSTFSLSEFRDAYWATSNKSSRGFGIMAKYCQQAGFFPKVAFEASSFQGVVSAVKVRKLIAMVSAGALNTVSHEGLRTLHISKPYCYFPFYLAWLKNRPLSEPAKEVRDFIIDLYTKKPLQYSVIG